MYLLVPGRVPRLERAHNLNQRLAAAEALRDIFVEEERRVCRAGGGRWREAGGVEDPAELPSAAARLHAQFQLQPVEGLRLSSKYIVERGPSYTTYYLEGLRLLVVVRLLVVELRFRLSK